MRLERRWGSIHAAIGWEAVVIGGATEPHRGQERRAGILVRHHTEERVMPKSSAREVWVREDRTGRPMKAALTRRGVGDADSYGNRPVRYIPDDLTTRLAEYNGLLNA